MIFCIGSYCLCLNILHNYSNNTAGMLVLLYLTSYAGLPHPDFISQLWKKLSCENKNRLQDIIWAWKAWVRGYVVPLSLTVTPYLSQHPHNCTLTYRTPTSCYTQGFSGPQGEKGDMGDVGPTGSSVSHILHIY